MMVEDEKCVGVRKVRKIEGFGRRGNWFIGIEFSKDIFLKSGE